MTAHEKRQFPSQLPNARRFHLLGCCGTGMGALGVLLRRSGYEVSGSDIGFYPPMSTILEHSGIRTMHGWSADHLDALDPGDTTVVVGNFCRRANEECQAAMERGFTTLSQPETLYHFYLRHAKRRIVVSGTHGKTTTSALIAAILNAAAKDPSVFIGGEVKAYGCGAHLGKGQDFIVEGDEYDTAWFDKVPKFWHYAPTHLCINNIEFDHADIYKDIHEIIGVFTKLVRDMGPNGTVVYNADDPNAAHVASCAPGKTVGFSLNANPNADFWCERVHFNDGGIQLCVRDVRHDMTILQINSPLTGRHNAYNITAASVMAHMLGDIGEQAILHGLAQYQGVKKRQELIGTANGIAIYDDFAHHPTAVRETVNAIRARHPGQRLWGILEMKSNTSRRSIFQQDYVDALEKCDKVILSAPWKKDDLPPDMLINIPKIADDLQARGIDAQMIPKVDDIVKYLAQNCRNGDIVLGMSGSAFDGLHYKLLSEIKAQPEHTDG